MDAYEVLDRVGQGSFGVVSRVRRRSDGKVLVWKELSYGAMSDKEKQLIVSEVNILRELRHPYVVRYYDRVIDKAASKLYIVMEFCEGGDVGQVLRRCKRDDTYLDEAFIWKVLGQLALALKDCHRHREGGTVRPILHRDIKPGNVLLDAQKNVKLGDFGLAKELGSRSTFARTNVGTPFYMSPELINEARYNDRSDIWSLGCLTYEMAARSPPFNADNQLALARKITAGRFPRIPERYSEALQRAIESMLQIDQARRPRIDDVLRLPQLAGVVAESQIVVKEFSLAQRYGLKAKELKDKEEGVRRREEAVRRREEALARREQELRRRFPDAFVTAAPPASTLMPPAAASVAASVAASAAADRPTTTLLSASPPPAVSSRPSSRLTTTTTTTTPSDFDVYGGVGGMVAPPRPAARLGARRRSFDDLSRQFQLAVPAPPAAPVVGHAKLLRPGLVSLLPAGGATAGMDDIENRPPPQTFRPRPLL